MTAETLKRPLSKAETELVERYHNLIYRVMGDIHMQEDAASDLYGEAALALILAAQRYLTDESLQKYRFTTIAYSRIRNVLLRQRRKLAKQPQTLSLDAALADGISTLYDVVANDCATDPAVIAEHKDAIRRLAARAVRSHKLYLVPNTIWSERTAA